MDLLTNEIPVTSCSVVSYFGSSHHHLVLIFCFLSSFCSFHSSLSNHQFLSDHLRLTVHGCPVNHTCPPLMRPSNPNQGVTGTVGHLVLDWTASTVDNCACNARFNSPSSSAGTQMAIKDVPVSLSPCTCFSRKSLIILQRKSNGAHLLHRTPSGRGGLTQQQHTVGAYNRSKGVAPIRRRGGGG